MRWRTESEDERISRRLRISQQRTMYFVGSATGCRSASLLLADNLAVMLYDLSITRARSNVARIGLIYYKCGNGP